MDTGKLRDVEFGSLVTVAIRVALGWIMLWAFLDKMFGLGFETPAGSGFVNGGSPSSYVVYVTNGVFKDLFTSLAGNTVVDVLLLLACLGLGLSFILGFASRLSTVLMSVFLAVMFLLEVPPTDNPLIDYHVIYILAVLAVYLYGGFEKLSLNQAWVKLPVVRDFRILQ